MRNAIKGLLILSCALSAFAREEYTRDFRKTADLPAGRTFRIENSLGNVNIHTQAKNEVSIQATIRCSADNREVARTCTNDIRIEVQDSSAGLSIRTEYPPREHWSTRNMGYSVSYEIVIPESAPLEVRNRFGNVIVSNPRAGSEINNGNGAVKFSGGRGRLHLENSFGDVEVAANDGDVVIVNANGGVVAGDVTGALDIAGRFGNVRVTNVARGVTIHNGNGKVDVSRVSGIVSITNSFGAVAVYSAKSNVTVQNQNGEITATDISGRAELNTSFGAVKFSRIGKELLVHATNTSVTGDTVGGNASAETTFGNIDIRGVQGFVKAVAGNSSIRLAAITGAVDARTSFGGVTIDQAGGPITVEDRNGSVTAISKPNQRCQPVTLHTSFGSIRVTVPAATGYTVYATTTFGRIHSDKELMVSGALSENTVNGKIGGGGCELRLTNENGSIDIL